MGKTINLWVETKKWQKMKEFKDREGYFFRNKNLVKRKKKLIVR
jgi:hypothetical protein